MEILYQDRILLFCIRPGPVYRRARGLPNSSGSPLRQKRGCARWQPAGPCGQRAHGPGPPLLPAFYTADSEGGFEKEYLAVVHGAPAEERGTFRDLLWAGTRPGV